MIVALPLRPEVGKSMIDAGVFKPGADSQVWASPEVARVMGGPLGSLGSFTLPGGASFQPLPVPESGAMQFSEWLDLADQVVGPALEKGVDARQISGVAAGQASAVMASVEMLAEYVHPSDKGTFEKAVFYTQKGATVLNAVTDFVPVLHGAKPVLMAVVQVGDQVCAAFRMNAGDARKFQKLQKMPIKKAPR
jgi:hypothetical protein